MTPKQILTAVGATLGACVALTFAAWLTQEEEAAAILIAYFTGLGMGTLFSPLWNAKP